MSTLKDIKEVLDTDIAKEIYKDGLKPTVKNTGGILSTVTGFFNHVVLYPLKNLNASFEYKALSFQRELEEKYNKIPEEKRCDSPLEIIGPALESLKYRLNNEQIKDMFENLIANSMNIELTNMCHPRFVEIINVLSSIDAVFFQRLIDTISINVCQPIIFVENKGTQSYLPKYVCDIDYGTFDLFDISSSISNIVNLGLATLEPFEDEHYSTIERIVDNDKLKALVDNLPIDLIKEIYPDATNSDCKISGARLCELSLTDFGNDFANVCLK